MTNIIDVNNENFSELVIKGSEKLPVVVDFWAPWCSPCKQLTPIIEKAANNYPDKVILAKINIDENQSIAAQMQIQSIPMVYAFFKGQVVDGFQGNIPESQVLEFIKKVSELSGPSPEIIKHLEKLELYQQIQIGRKAYNYQILFWIMIKIILKPVMVKFCH